MSRAWNKRCSRFGPLQGVPPSRQLAFQSTYRLPSPVASHPICVYLRSSAAKWSCFSDSGDSARLRRFLLPSRSVPICPKAVPVGRPNRSRPYPDLSQRLFNFQRAAPLARQFAWANQANLQQFRCANQKRNWSVLLLVLNPASDYTVPNSPPYSASPSPLLEKRASLIHSHSHRMVQTPSP